MADEDTSTNVERGRAALSRLVEGLAGYYHRQYPDRVNQLISEVDDITMGWEARLYSFIVEFMEAGRRVREERVVRLYLGNYASEKAANEFKVMGRLFEAGYPVPQVFHLETDGAALGSPFIIMERIRGRNMSEDLRRATGEEFRSLMTVFTELWVDLHNLDEARLFPGEFKLGSTPEYLDETLGSARRRIEEYGLGWLGPVFDWLDEHKAGVTPEGLSIIHRDYHTKNLMLREDGSPVVLDWTAATAGDYRDDLAWAMLLMGTYGDPALRDIILETYQEVSGREVRDIEFFEALAVGRRLIDVSGSLTRGAEEMGLRPEAVEMMRRDSEHLHGVYALLTERTGLRLPEFEDILDNLN